MRTEAEAAVLAETLTTAIGAVMSKGKSPQRKVGQLDNRGSHFYLALYWAEALAAQSASPALRERFAPAHAQLAASEEQILAELAAAQGQPVDIGGYYFPDTFRLSQAMRPSPGLGLS